MSSRHSLLVLLCFVAALLGACAPQNAAGDTATRIETDQNTIRFIVNGQEEARIDHDGLHVRDGVTSATSHLVGSNAPYPPDASGDPTK